MTILKLAGEPFPLRQIEHASIQYIDAECKARRRSGRYELMALVEALRPDVYWSADPYIRFPPPPPGKPLYPVLSLETLPPFLDNADGGWRKKLHWHWKAQAQLVQAQAIICPNHMLAVAYVAHLGLRSRHKTVVVPNGVHPIFRRHTEEEILEVRRKWLIPKRYVLLVGDARNADALAIPLGALARSEEVSSMACVVLGDAGLPEALRETIRDCHLEGMVRFLDAETVPVADVSTIYSGALVTFDPMQSAEYRPTVLQSMACGTPVICAAGALSEELYGNAVLRVHPTDTNEWAQVYTALVLSTVLRERQIARGAAYVAERTWTATAKISFHLLRALVEKRFEGSLSKVLE